MDSADRIAIAEHATEVRDAARRLHHEAGEPGASFGAPSVLASLEEALQLLSAGWYEVAADAGPWAVRRRRRFSRSAKGDPPADHVLTHEEEVRLVATLHHLAAAFARCARACREARPTVAPLIERRALTRVRQTAAAGVGGEEQGSQASPGLGGDRPGGWAA